MEERQTIRFDKGTITRVTWQCDDIRLGHSVSKCDERFSHPASNQNDVVRLHFGLKGDYLFTYKQLNRTFDLIGGHHNIMYSKGFDMVVQNKTLELETFGIQFPIERFIQFTANTNDNLDRFAGSILNGKSVLLSEKWGTINSSIQQVISQIIYCKYAGEIKKVFLLSKTVELLVLCAESYEVANSDRETFIKTKTDREKIIAVRDFVNERVHCPPSLSEVSNVVGLNEYKLKRGFKEVFDNTVFGYLTDQRLHLARRYLLDTKNTAAEIAYQLGYATPQHFNNAFKKKFGITPYAIRNNP